jgi:predicted acylesterase/phospholipase RssA
MLSFPLSQMKTALVLSGGGMFGAYQAGVWKALADKFAPDIVVGASVGALNGWYIAAGAGPKELEQSWLDPANSALMALRKWHRPWGTVFDPGPLEIRVKQLLNNYKLRTDYGVALVQLPWLRPKLVRNGEVTWRHLVASCAVPVGFPPVRIGGGLYCDGGLLEATPIWAAVEMGATQIIAVNASRFIPPPGVGLMIKGVRRLRRGVIRGIPSDGPDIVMITPKVEFGGMLEGAVWQVDNIRRWIDMGESDARLALERNQ